MGEGRRPDSGSSSPLSARDEAKLFGPVGLNVEAFRAQVRDLMFPTEQLHAIVRQFTWPLEALQEQIAGMGEPLRQAVAEAMPPNWEGRDVGEVDRFLAMSAETGLNVVWVPRLDILEQLAAAEGEAERNAVLTDRRDDILPDIEACLDEVTHDGVADELHLAKSAVAAVRDGYEAPGQALAASVLSGLVHTTFDFKRLATARERFIRDDPDQVALRMFRVTVILRTFGRALARTDEADPGFNRHASLHALEGQYTGPNAISALLLLAGVIREVDHLLHRQDREVGVGDAAA
jgi:hypothetical protein